MKVTVEFDLPEERPELRMALKGADVYAVLCDYDEYLRLRLKHDSLPEAVAEALQAARNKLHSLATEHNVSVWGDDEGTEEC